MPRAALSYLTKANKTELKVVMYLFSAGSAFNWDQCERDLKCTRTELESALSFWRGTGVIEDADLPESADAEGVRTDPLDAPYSNSNKTAAAAEQALPFKSSPLQGKNSAVGSALPAVRQAAHYSIEELARAKETNMAFASLVEFAERELGTLFNPTETEILYALHDDTGMSCDVIMGVVAYCASVGKRSVRYVAKTALNIHDEGVRTYKELEQYLNRQRAATEFEGKVKKLIGANDRALTKEEKKHIARWKDEFKTSDELLSAAYEKTIHNIAKPSVSYMSKILENWHASGIQTCKDIEGEKADQEGLSFDLNDFFERPEKPAVEK